MKLYNTLTRSKEEFVPINKDEVKIYSCGPTVYNYFHIGNARPFIIFDILRRYLEYKGYKVIYVQNFTDIDDKMIKKANQENKTVAEIADFFINEYYVDAKGLMIREATYHPRATECIEDIIKIIKILKAKGFAYLIDGDVYFETQKFKDYGKLSHQSLENLESGTRIEVNTRKRGSMDFALWKSRKEGEPYWDSPWGKGRPGWHIECSAMINKYLGSTIDIHCGGQDLIFPHHENEIAQSEAANDLPFAHYLLHNGFINVNNEKMSKSLGNFFTVRDIVQKFEYEVIRFFMLSAHYRNPINFSDDLLEQSKNALSRIYNCLRNLEDLIEKNINLHENNEDSKFLDTLSDLKNKFIENMDDDLNTADAIARIFDIVKEINAKISQNQKYTKQTLIFCHSLIKELGGLLGICQKEQNNNIDMDIEKLLEKRQTARKEKNFKKSDEIRDKLKSMGIVLEDTPNGVRIVKT